MGAFVSRLVRLGINRSVKSIPYTQIKPDVGNEFDFINDISVKCRCCGDKLAADAECNRCHGVCVTKKKNKSKKGLSLKKKHKKKSKSSKSEGVEDVKIFKSVIHHRPPSPKACAERELVKKRRFFRPPGPRLGVTPPIYF